MNPDDLSAVSVAPVVPAPAEPAVVPLPGAVVSLGVSPSVPEPALERGDVVGRFTRMQLEAMRGKRGRKPSEYFQLFPRESGGVGAAVRGGKIRQAYNQQLRDGLKSTRPSPRHGPLQAPVVSSARLGKHSIDELLAMIGVRGAKPVAYTILQQVAQAFAERTPREQSRVSAQDSLAQRIAAAPKQVRASIELLLAAAAQRQR